MNTFKRAVLAVIALVCASQVHAQTTNLVQELGIQLFGFSQGGVTHFGSTVETNVNIVRVDTRQIIQALGVATLNSFSSTSKLVVVSPLDGGTPSVQVRDGNKTPVDVTDFVVLQAVTGSINNSVFNTKTGRGSIVSYEIARFALQDADGVTLNLHFDVSGIATSNSTTPMFGPQNSTVDANVSGGGDSKGNLIIFQGSVSIFGRTLEVDGGFTGVS
jgi:hypothetical protein